MSFATTMRRERFERLRSSLGTAGEEPRRVRGFDLTSASCLGCHDQVVHWPQLQILEATTLVFDSVIREGFPCLVIHHCKSKSKRRTRS